MPTKDNSSIAMDFEDTIDNDSLKILIINIKLSTF